MTSLKTLTTTLGTFLKSYGGSEYKNAELSSMKMVFTGLMEILNLDGPTSIIKNKLIKKINNMKTKEKLLFAVSEEMFKLEGMGTE